MLSPLSRADFSRLANSGGNKARRWRRISVSVFSLRIPASGLWLRSSELFHTARRALDANHFPFDQPTIRIVWSALCATDDNHDEVTPDAILSMIGELLRDFVEPVSPMDVELLTRQDEASFIRVTLWGCAIHKTGNNVDCGSRKETIPRALSAGDVWIRGAR